MKNRIFKNRKFPGHSCPPTPPPQVEHPDLDKDSCVMKVEDGVYFLYTPKGEKLRLQKNAIVLQTLGDAQDKFAWARITLIVRLADSK